MLRLHFAALISLLWLQPRAWATTPEGATGAYANACIGANPVGTSTVPAGGSIFTGCPNVNFNVQASDGIQCTLHHAVAIPGTMALYHFDGDTNDYGPLGINGVQAAGGGGCSSFVSTNYYTTGVFGQAINGSGSETCPGSPPTSITNKYAMLIGNDNGYIGFDDRSFSIEMWTKVYAGSGAGPPGASGTFYDPGAGHVATLFRDCPDPTVGAHKCMWIHYGDATGPDTTNDDGDCSVHWQFDPNDAPNNAPISNAQEPATDPSREDIPELRTHCANGVPALNDGNWHYLAFVYNASGKTQTIYVDGKSAASQSINSNFKGSSNHCIGVKIYDCATRLDNGLDSENVALDDLRISQIALDPNLIRARAGPNPGTATPAAIGSYYMPVRAGGEGSPTAICASGSDNTATPIAFNLTPSFAASGENGYHIFTLNNLDEVKYDALDWNVDVVNVAPPVSVKADTVTANGTTNSQIRICWNNDGSPCTDASYTCNTANTTYSVSVDGSPPDPLPNTNMHYTTAPGSGFLPNTPHTFKVRSAYLSQCTGNVWAAGPGNFTAPITAYTLANPPVSVSTAPLSDATTTTLSWQANGNPAYTGYKVWVSSYNFASSNSYQVLIASTLIANSPITVSSAPGSYYFVKASSYAFVVQAINGDGIYTVSAPAVPISPPLIMYTQPTSPANFSGQPYSYNAGVNDGLPNGGCPKTQIKWKWSPAAFASCPGGTDGTNCYNQIYSRADSTLIADKFRDFITSGAYVQSGLLPGTAYTNYIVAVDTNVPGAFSRSDNLFSTGHSSAPYAAVTTAVKDIGVVGNLTGTPDPANPATAIDWSWTPSSNACYPYTYNVFASTDPAFKPLATINGSPPATSWTTSGLQPNTTFSITVGANDGVGYSTSPAAMTIYTAALAPSALSAAAQSATSVLLSWTLPPQNPPYTRYEIDDSNADAGFSSGYQIVKSLGDNYTGPGSLLVGGLNPSTTYYFRVRALNGRAGDGGLGGLPSSGATASAPTYPAPPGGLAGTAIDTGTVQWTWSADPTAASYQITAFMVNGGLAPSNLAPNCGANAGLCFQNVGLSSNSVSQITLKTTNASGQGAGATSPTVYSLAAAPSGFILDSTTTVGMAFHWGANGNPSYTRYEVDYSSANSGAWSSAPSPYTAAFSLGDNHTAASASLAGLLPSTLYYLRVRAFNSQSPQTSGVVAAAADLTAGIPTLPLPPSGITAAANGTGSVAWSWNPVATANNPPSSGYQISEGDHNSVGSISTCSGQPCATVSVPTPNGESKISVVTVNASGVSAPSSTQYGYSLANAPQSLVVPAISSSSVTLSWDSKLNSNLTTYEIVSDISSSFNVATATRSTTQTSYVFSSLLPQNLYYFQVRARNGAGTPTAFTASASALTAADPSISTGTIPSGGAPFVLTAPDLATSASIPPNVLPAGAAVYISTNPLASPIASNPVSLQSSLASVTGVTEVPSSLREFAAFVNGRLSTGTFSSPVTISLPYSDVGNTGVVDGISPPLLARQLQVATLNPVTNTWSTVPGSQVDLSNHVVRVAVPHFSVYGLFGVQTIASTLTGVKVYPVPWKAGGGDAFDSAVCDGVSGLVFGNLPSEGKIRLYTVNGELVRGLSFGILDGGCKAWDGKNGSGRKAASGLYLAVVDSGSERVVLKAVVER